MEANVGLPVDGQTAGVTVKNVELPTNAIFNWHRLVA